MGFFDNLQSRLAPMGTGLVSPQDQQRAFQQNMLLGGLNLLGTAGKGGPGSGMDSTFQGLTGALTGYQEQLRALQAAKMQQAAFESQQRYYELRQRQMEEEAAREREDALRKKAAEADELEQFQSQYGEELGMVDTVQGARTYHRLQQEKLDREAGEERREFERQRIRNAEAREERLASAQEARLSGDKTIPTFDEYWSKLPLDKRQSALKSMYKQMQDESKEFLPGSLNFMDYPPEELESKALERLRNIYDWKAPEIQATAEQLGGTIEIATQAPTPQEAAQQVVAPPQAPGTIPMPPEFVEKGGTQEEWDSMTPEEQMQIIRAIRGFG